MAVSTEPLPAKHSVLGVGISSTSYKEVMRLCRHWIGLHGIPASPASGATESPGPEPGHCVFICTVNAVMTAVFQPAFRRLLNAGDLATTDGMPLAWALRSFGVKGQRRVYGPDLMLALCGQSARLGRRVFLFGGREDVLPQLRRRLERRFPGLNIVGLVIHFTLVGGLGLGDNVSIGQGLTENQLFDESVEDLAYVAGLSTVEAKGEFIEVALQMHFTHLPLVRRYQPALEQRGNQVDMREFLGGYLRVSRCVGDPIAIAGFLQAPVTPPAVAMDQTA